jgi:IS5 family transposase
MLTGVTVRRIHGDKDYRGHNYPNRFKVWISGQVRRVTKAIRREMRRRAAIEPVIGHLMATNRIFDACKGRREDFPQFRRVWPPCLEGRCNLAVVAGRSFCHI